MKTKTTERVKLTQSLTYRKCVHKTLLTFKSVFYYALLLFKALFNSNLNDEKTNQIRSVNLVLQFLFFELRSSNLVRKWFMRKLSNELDELTKTTIGKFFSKLSVSILIRFLQMLKKRENCYNYKVKSIIPNEIIFNFR